MTTTVASPPPWPGPRPYDEPEWRVFAGRNKEIRDVFRQLVAHRLTVVSGPSGAGKTSVIGAGEVPLLRRRRYRLSAATGHDNAGQSAEWPVLVLRDWGR